ncbi:hypothetical protein DPEC_G00218880 [Dallia pectoralis]|uniref:Uncharacterized protein n=1 Tax=Dallia pectoralis TaxID=75939 RepID=A0ACC2G359_DALPE|nr:hypothetical protein DPEC_G00218880 [Dallia pectoralis]
MNRDYCIEFNYRVRQSVPYMVLDVVSCAAHVEGRRWKLCAKPNIPLVAGLGSSGSA